MNIQHQQLPTQTPSKSVCPACQTGETFDVFDGGRQPVNVGVFYDTASEARAAPRGQIQLAFCPACGFVHNRGFDAAADIFKPGYEVALHHSETFRQFISGVAARLIDRFDLKHKRVIEIGCGDGFFLQTLARLAEIEGIGIDPTVASEGQIDVDAGQVRLIRDYFGPHHHQLDADFVCSLSVFEDIPQPTTFLAAVHSLARQGNAPLYFEVFNAWRAFEQHEVWSVHYEQCNYFSHDSLRRVFGRNGFDVTASGTCYQGDQYLFLEATAVDRSAPDPIDPPSGEQAATLRSFSRLHGEKLADWTQRLHRFRTDGQRVVVWGTGGKGITFLNSLPDAELIEYVVEINPDKQGRFVPGTGQRIVSPEFLAPYQPHKIIITNPLYEAEMKQQAAAMGVHAEFLVA